MELQELATFVSVARYGNFSRAAEAIGYSQAAVTIQIKNLEEELDIRLFDRIGKRVLLTNRGKIFYDRVVVALNNFENAREAVLTGTQLVGTLNIGTIDSLCSSVFPMLLKRFYEKHPGVSVNVVTDTPRVLFDMLHKNELDVVYLLDDRVNDSHFVTVYEKEAPVVFAAMAGHPLADGKEHTITELLEYPFILTEKNASYRKVLDGQLLRRKQEIHPHFQSNNTDLLVSMFPNNDYISFLPVYAIERGLRKNRLSIIQVPDVSVNVWLQLIHHREKWVTREMQAFFDLLTE